jgi:hypothetical protein
MRRLFWCWAALALGACTAHAPRRMDLGQSSAQAVQLTDLSGSRDASRFAAEIYPDFTLAFIEFDDQGRLWSRAQLDLLDSTLATEAERDSYEGIAVVLFAHGWQHDADVCDANVACFRTFLAQIASDLGRATGSSAGQEKPPRVVGIYVGWRGRSIDFPVLADFSFWARKHTAERIGAGELVEVLTHVDQFVRRQNGDGRYRSGLNVIGHSLGGTMVYGALANVFKARVVEALGRRASLRAEDNLISGFGDIVLLVNPAFEASLYAPFEDILARFQTFSPYQSPVLVIAESETDGPNRRWFPIGRGLDTLFQRTGPRSERSLLTTAVGNYEPFVTHRLEAVRPEAADGPAAAKGFGDVTACSCRLPVVPLPEEELRLLRSFIARERRGALTEDPGFGAEPDRCAAGLDIGRARLTCRAGLEPNRPFWVVRATDDVIQGHSGIFTGPFLSFVRYVILTARMKAAMKAGSPNQADSASRRME